MLSDKNYNCMKRKVILFAAGAVFLAASVVTFVSVTCSNDPMDNLFMANVEALANEETYKNRIQSYLDLPRRWGLECKW